jgi:hypothetical protein
LDSCILDGVAVAYQHKGCIRIMRRNVSLYSLSIKYGGLVRTNLENTIYPLSLHATKTAGSPTGERKEIYFLSNGQKVYVY